MRSRIESYLFRLFWSLCGAAGLGRRSVMTFCDDAISVARPRFGRPGVEKDVSNSCDSCRAGPTFPKIFFFCTYKKVGGTPASGPKKDGKNAWAQWRMIRSPGAGPEKQVKNSDDQKNSILLLQTTVGTGQYFVKKHEKTDRRSTGSTILRHQ